MCTCLLVEDSPSEVYLMKTVLTESALPVELHAVPDGHEALTFLRRENEHATAPRPDFILLDINMPRKNGFEVLAEVKKDRDLKRIPVVMLSASELKDDINNSYELRANAYMRKPLSLEDYRVAVKALFEFWCNHVLLPPP